MKHSDVVGQPGKNEAVFFRAAEQPEGTVYFNGRLQDRIVGDALKRSDEFYGHGIVQEFSKRKGWISKGIDWTRLFLLEKEAQALENLIKVHQEMSDEGLIATPEEIFDVLGTLFSRGTTIISGEELRETIRQGKVSDRGRGEHVFNRLSVWDVTDSGSSGE